MIHQLRFPVTILPGSRKLYSLTETGLHFVALYL